MLAEIFMVHAESLASDRKEKLPVSSSPFIPLDGALQLKFKDGTKGTPREAPRADQAKQGQHWRVFV
jgi:hypothetical protein